MNKLVAFIENNLNPYVLPGLLGLVLIILVLEAFLCHRARKNKPLKGLFIGIIIVWVLALVASVVYAYIVDPASTTMSRGLFK